MVSFGGVRTCSIARSGPRGILLQCGHDQTAGHEHEEQRQKDKTDRSRTKMLWFSHPHEHRRIALFRPEVRSATGRDIRSLPTPFNQQGKARLAPVGREVIFSSGIYTYGSLRPAGLSRWKCTLALPSVSRARNLNTDCIVVLNPDDYQGDPHHISYLVGLFPILRFRYHHL
jgi:hypothetical protein